MKTKKAIGFTQISNQLLRSTELSLNEKMILMIIMSHDQKVFNIRREILCAQAGLDLKTGQRTIKSLVEKNMLNVTKIRYKKTFHYKYEILSAGQFEPVQIDQVKMNQSKLSTLKNTNIKEEQSVPFEEDAIKSPLQAVLPSFFNEDEKTTIPSLKELLPRVVLELTEETTGFNPNVNPLEAVEALETLKKQMALDGSITAPDSGRKFNLLKYIETIKETI